MITDVTHMGLAKPRLSVAERNLEENFTSVYLDLPGNHTVSICLRDNVWQELVELLQPRLLKKLAHQMGKVDVA